MGAASPQEESARHLTDSALPAALVTAKYSGSSTDPLAILKALQTQADDLQHGDLTQIEQMLIHQAVALQSMFMDLAVRAKGQQDLPGVQALTQLALKAQSGSRATLQTLAELKNPRPVFVRQTNVAQNQQVNNGSQEAVAVLPSRARKPHNAPIELKAPTQERHGSPTLDPRATTAAGRADSDEPALGALHRPAQHRR
jgi:hypothetical protein